MLRIKDPKKSLEFYCDKMGCELVNELHFEQAKFSLYFLGSFPEGHKLPDDPKSPEAGQYARSVSSCLLELTHNWGTETDPDFKHHNGNSDPRGFGHIGFLCDNLAERCEKLESEGVGFQKRPHEGNMHNIAFALDPDGYWVEIVKRATPGKIPNYFNFSQTMLRIKDPKKSIPFYEAMGMTVVRAKDYGDFSNFFLASSSNVEEGFDYTSLSNDDSKEKLSDMFGPILELTHNHGTEDDDDFKHYNGNEEGRQGFGHIGFLVDDVYKACDGIREMGYGFKKEPDGGSMKGLAFAWDPDGYPIEIIKRGGIEFGDKRA